MDHAAAVCMPNIQIAMPAHLPFGLQFSCTVVIGAPSSMALAMQVVVDFYKTACGSCRYIQPGFVKLCQASEAGKAAVVFLKHNIFDE